MFPYRDLQAGCGCPPGHHADERELKSCRSTTNLVLLWLAASTAVNETAGGTGTKHKFRAGVTGNSLTDRAKPRGFWRSLRLFAMAAQKLFSDQRGPFWNPSDPKGPTMYASPEHCKFLFYKETSLPFSFNGFIHCNACSRTKWALWRHLMDGANNPIPQHTHPFTALNLQYPLKTILGEPMIQVPF